MSAVLFRKSMLISILVLALVLTTVPTFAHAVNGCYATVPSTTVNEDELITVTIQCDNIPTGNNLFGFQLATTFSGDLDAATAPTTYSAGTFADAATGAVSSLVVGANSVSGLYAVTQQGAEVVNTEDFSLSTYGLYAEDDLSTADGSVVVLLNDSNFILSDN